MKFKSFSVLLLLLSGLANVAIGGKYNTVLSPGDAAPDWKDVPGIDGKKHSLADFKDKDVLVVVFTCNSCPYAVDYEDRINALAKRFVDLKQNAAVVAINSNKIESDLMPAMKKRAEEKSFQFAYLFDETQQVAKQFGAIHTPEFFVLNKDRKIVYMGAMDDNTKSESVTKKYLESAVDSLTAGKPLATAETAPVGCLIRFDRRRK